MLAEIYRKVVPVNVRRWIYGAFLGRLLSFKRNFTDERICFGYRLKYLFRKPSNAMEQAYKNLGILGYTLYPYLWKKEYDLDVFNISGGVNPENGLPYVWHNGHQLYFKRSMSVFIDKAYQELCIEQDPRSAHRYVKSYEELRGRILFDVGAAEANFTLDTIEYVDHAYLFECDEEWIEALEATFAPWKEKVTIVRKYVSDVDDAENITIDTFIRQQKIAPERIFLKMDIEGYERRALDGARWLLKEGKENSGAVCIYHLADDKAVITSKLKALGLRTEVQPGYLYLGRELRSGILWFES